MTTATVPSPGAVRRSAGRLAGVGRSRSRVRSAGRDGDRWPAVLGVALLLIAVLAVFAHGAVGTTPSARVEVTVVLVACAAAVGVARGALSLRVPRTAWLPVALLAGLVVWSGLSLAWSVSPDGTWLEFNREAAYALTLGLGVLIGAAHPAALRRVGDAVIALGAAVALYAIAQKVIPEVHIGGLIDFNRTGQVPRLQEPLGYWNGLGLLEAMAGLLALFRVVERTRAPQSRYAHLVVAQLALVTIGFTLSRGALLAAIIALAVGGALSRAGLRVLLWTVVALLGALAPLVIGLSLHDLTNAGVALSDRAGAGAILGAILLLSLAGMVYGASRVLLLEAELSLGPEALVQIRRAVALSALAVVLLGVLALALSSRGLGGQISHAWHSFTSNPGANTVYDPQRLISEDSEHRWGWWKEAAGAFSDRPLAGWGAGAFPVVHLLYRQDLLSVTQPHSLPLQFLAETGLIGALLGLGAVAALVIAGVRAARRSDGPERLVRIGILSAGLAFAVQSLYDWGWDIPGLALPALVLLGVLTGSTARGANQPSAATAAMPANRGGLPVALPGGGNGVRLIALLAAVLLLCGLAVGAILPSAAASDASAALAGASGNPAGMPAAIRKAVLASELDPLSDAGLRVEATVAQRRGDLGGARGYLLQALRRDPTDVLAWELLAQVDLALGDLDGAAGSARHALELDPTGLRTGSASFFISQLASLLLTAPRDSASTGPTPIPGAPLNLRAPAVPLPKTALTPTIPATASTPTTSLRSPVDPSTTVSAGPSPTTPPPTGQKPASHHTSGGTSPGGTSTVTQTYSSPPSSTGNTAGNTGASPGVTVTTPPPPPPTTTTTQNTGTGGGPSGGGSH